MYPSRRYFIGLGVLIALVGIFIGIVKLTEVLKERRAKAEEAKSIALQGLIVARSQQGLEELNQKDADGDGLPDWKEALWQLDPANPDTDGNGVLDGEQIRLREKELQESGSASDSTKMSTTDMLARDIYTAVTVLDQSGELTPENRERLTQQIQTSIYDAVPTVKYTTADVQIVASNNETRAGYVNLLQKQLNQFSPEDFSTVLESATVTDRSQINPVQVAAVIKKYDAIVTNLLKIPVPSNLAESHIQLVNVMVRLTSNLAGISSVDTDPLAGFVGVVQIQDTLDQLSTILAN